MLKIDQESCGFVTLLNVGTSRRRFEADLQKCAKGLQAEGRPVDYRGVYELMPSGQLAVHLVWWGQGLTLEDFQRFARQIGATVDLEISNAQSLGEIYAFEEADSYGW